MLNILLRRLFILILMTLGARDATSQMIIKRAEIDNVIGIKNDLIIHIESQEVSIIQYANPFYGIIKKGSVCAIISDSIFIEMDSMTRISLNTGFATMPWRNLNAEKNIITRSSDNNYEVCKQTGHSCDPINGGFYLLGLDSLNSVEKYLLNKH